MRCAEPKLVITRGWTRVFGYASTCAFLIIATLLYLRPVLRLAGTVGTVVWVLIAAGLGYLVLRYLIVLVSVPALVVNCEGISDNTSIAGPWAIKWREIADVFPVSANSRTLGVVPKDRQTLAISSDPVSRAIMSVQAGLTGAPVWVTVDGPSVSGHEGTHLVLRHWAAHGGKPVDFGATSSGNSRQNGHDGRRSGQERRRPSHEVLGVRPGATLSEVNAAYRRQAQLYHPDRVADLAPELRELAERRMKEINAAYEELKRHARA